MVNIKKIKPYENNAKKHSKEQIEKLSASLRHIGFVRPLLIDEDCNLLAGHGVLAAAESIGMDIVPCLIVRGLSEAEKRAYIIADNKLAELSEWDVKLLDIEMSYLNEVGFCLDELGITPDIADQVEAIELSDEVSHEKNNRIIHCPKCGFCFEVSK